MKVEIIEADACLRLNQWLLKSKSALMIFDRPVYAIE